VARAFAARTDALDLEQARARARDLDYWRALDSTLSILEPLELAPASAPTRDDDAIERLGRDGTLRFEELVDAQAIERALRVVDVVVAAGWPRVFAWLFDDVWRCVRAPAVVSSLASVLGAGWRQLPGVWVNHTAPVEGAAGWGPHVDVGGAAARMPDGAPARLTGWLSLTPATLDNGCMHYVPAHATGELAARFETLERVDFDDVARWLHHARALVAEPGTLLCWRFDVLHWGGVATAQAEGPRIALAFEAAHEGATLDARDGPAFALDVTPSFAQRLSIVGRGLLAYGKAKEREPFAHRFVPLGEDLCDLWLDER
jgi:hypothetical protein